MRALFENDTWDFVPEATERQRYIQRKQRSERIKEIKTTSEKTKCPSMRARARTFCIREDKDP